MCGRFSSLIDRFRCARSLSAGVPCLSPLESFLYAYITLTGLLDKNWPFIASMAASEASKVAKLTKPNPLDSPVSGSRITFGVRVTTPKALKVSYRYFSSTSGSRLPTKRLAPTSCSMRSLADLFTFMGLSYTLSMFKILMA